MKNLFTFILIFAIVSNMSSQEPVTRDITCSQALNLIQSFGCDTGFVIIDLRPQLMYDEGHIENAISYDVYSDQFESWIEELDKNNHYLLYCNIGQRSRIGMEKMEALGFKNLYHLYEGLVKWKSEGYSTVR